MSGPTCRGKLISGGRLQVPAELRRQLASADGDAVGMEVADGKLRVRSARPNWECIHAIVR